MSNIAVVAHREKVKPATLKGLKAALADAGVKKEPWFLVEKGSKAKRAAEKALKTGADVVLVCGGDGTVRAAAEALVGTDAALAVVPTGTANLFAGGLELPTDPAEVVALARGTQRRQIDTGVCNGLTFNVMAGAGLDAGMIDGADARKRRFGRVAYVRAAVHEARERTAFVASVQIDGEQFFDGPATCVLVGNLGTVSGGLEVLPDASPTDGRLDVAVVTAVGTGEWARVLMSAIRGQQHRSGMAHLGQGCEISVALDDEHRFELDGGTKGLTDRLEFSIRPRSLTLCAPDRT
jgi:YegS/Rv2252/BmrU family lipid kinase